MRLRRQEIFEYAVCWGERKPDGIYTYPVRVEDINEMAAKGWRFVAFRGDGHTALMERVASKEKES